MVHWLSLSNRELNRHCTAAKLFFTLRKYCLTEVAFICSAIHHTSHKNPKVSRGSGARVFRVSMSAMLLLLMQGIKKVLRCGGILWHDDNTKFCCGHQIQNPKRTDTKRHKRRQSHLKRLLFYFL